MDASRLDNPHIICLNKRLQNKKWSLIYNNSQKCYILTFFSVGIHVCSLLQHLAEKKEKHPAPWHPWQASDNPCWLPSQPAFPTGCQLACCCHLRSTTATIITREAGWVNTGRKSGAREDGSCQLAASSPAHWDVKSVVGLIVALPDLYADSEGNSLQTVSFTHSLIWGRSNMPEHFQQDTVLRTTSDNDETIRILVQVKHTEVSRQSSSSENKAAPTH